MNSVDQSRIMDHQAVRDIAENLEYSFEQQCFLQLEKLRKELLSRDGDSNSRRISRQRLFRCNFFQEIDSHRRQYLDRVLCHTLKSLGEQIRNNLMNNARDGRSSTLSTPTPVRDLSLSPRSSCSRSVTISPQPSTHDRSRSTSPLKVCSELIVISSDEDDDIDDDIDDVVFIKEEPSSRCSSRSFNSQSPQPSQSGSLEDRPRSRSQARRPSTDSTLQPLSDLNGRPKVIATVANRTPPNSLLIVDLKNRANFLYDRNGIIYLKSIRNIKFCAKLPALQPLYLHLIAKAIKLIQSNTYMTKREIYYVSLEFCRSKNHKPQALSTQASSGTQNSQIASQFNSQYPHSTQPDTQNNSQSQSRPESHRHDPRRLDNALSELCCLVGCSFVHLHILPQSKGIVYGDLEFKLKSGEVFQCSARKEGVAIPTAQSPIVEIESNAKFILIVEKDSIMQTILSKESTSNFIQNYKCIVFTARGYPDITSKTFINYLWSKLKIPVLALTDADPHGLEIVCSYKFGNYASAYEGAYCVTPQIKWLGLLPSDVMKLSLPESQTMPHSPNDVKKIASLLNRPYLQKKPNWIRQLELMRDMGRKAELESLSNDGEYLVRTYLPNKLRYASWL